MDKTDLGDTRNLSQLTLRWVIRPLRCSGDTFTNCVDLYTPMSRRLVFSTITPGSNQLLSNPLPCPVAATCAGMTIDNMPTQQYFAIFQVRGGCYSQKLRNCTTASISNHPALNYETNVMLGRWRLLSTQIGQ